MTTDLTGFIQHLTVIGPVEGCDVPDHWWCRSDTAEHSVIWAGCYLRQMMSGSSVTTGEKEKP